MKTFILFFIIFSIKSYTQDFYEEMPDCFCKPFAIESKSEVAINDLGSYIDTCEINQLINTEGDETDNRCDFIANKHYKSTNGSENLNKYIKKIQLISENNLFDVSKKEIHYNMQINDITDDFLEIKEYLFEIEKYIGGFSFYFVQGNFYEIKFENYVSLEYINNNFSDFAEVNYLYLSYPLKNVKSKNADLFTFDNNQLIFNQQIQNLRITDLLGNYQNIDYKPEIDLSNLQRGIYILQFTHDNQIYNYKFLME